MRTSFKASLEMALGAVGEPLDGSPGLVTFPGSVVAIKRKKDDGRATMFADDTDTLKSCFHCSWCNNVRPSRQVRDPRR